MYAVARNSQLLVKLPGRSPTFSFINSVSAGSSDNGTFSTGTMDTTGAGLLIVGLSDYQLGTPVLSDSKTNSWNVLTAYSVSSDARSRIYWSIPTSVGASHSVTLTGTVFYGSGTFAAFGGGSVSPFDVEAGGTGTSVNPSAGAGITPTLSHELLVANVCFDGGTASSIGGGFTMLTPTAYASSAHYGNCLAYLIQTGIAAADPDWTLSGSTVWAASIAAFK